MQLDLIALAYWLVKLCLKYLNSAKCVVHRPLQVKLARYLQKLRLRQ
jgi:hypothetical protein